MTADTATRRTVLRGALALAGCAVAGPVLARLPEADSDRLARLLSTPGAVIEDQTFVLTKPVDVGDLHDITIRRCWFDIAYDGPALKCHPSHHVRLEDCTFRRISA